MRIGLIDLDGKLPNLALMKLSTYHKQQGHEVVLNDFAADKLYCSVVFTRSREKASTLKRQYPHMEIGGTGWDLNTKIPPEIHFCRPDYDLYTTEFIYERIRGGIGKKANKLKKAETIVNAGIGFTSRGCIRSCGFCVVPKAEGEFRQETEIGDLLNPRSNVLILLDNNLTADPYCLDKLREIKERGLTVDITQGIDVRLLTTTRAQRTGCSMCGFGIHIEKRPHRFDRLREDNPKEWHFWMYNCVTDEETGERYGWGRVLDYIGVKWEDEYIPQVQMDNLFDVCAI